jgi:hypothetical protein
LGRYEGYRAERPWIVSVEQWFGGSNTGVGAGGWFALQDFQPFDQIVNPVDQIVVALLYFCTQNSPEIRL